MHKHIIHKHRITGFHKNKYLIFPLFISVRKMDLEQSVKNLQAQNNQFQKVIFHLAKGQEELKALLIEKEKNQYKYQGGQDNQRSKPKRSFTPLHMPLSQAMQQLLNQNLITLLPPYSLPTNPAPGYKYHARCAYHSNSPGHDTEDCGPLKHMIQDLIDCKIIDFNSPEKPHMANTGYNRKGRNELNQSVGTIPISTLAPQQRRKSDTSKRQFTKINMSLAQALQHLLRENLITLRDPPVKPNTSAPGYKLNVRCTYPSNKSWTLHKQFPDITKNNCRTLKNKIQDLINDGEINFNSPETPVVITAPIPSHDKAD